MSFSIFIGLLFLVNCVIANPYGGLVVIADCNTADSTQKWVLKNQQLVNGNGLCLDVSNNAVQDGTDVQVYECQTDGRASQKWSVVQGSSTVVGMNGFLLAVEGDCRDTRSYVVMRSPSYAGYNGTVWYYNNSMLYSYPSGRCLALAGKPSSDNVIIPLVIGHRGLPARFPENTMIGFKAAIDAGADGLETDLRFTSDKKIVLSHDDTLDRVTNCTGKIADYTYDYITTKCDAGIKFGYPGNFVPSFEDVVKLAKDREFFIVMDMKENGLADEIYRIINKHSYYQGIASMWYQEQLDDMRRVNPNVPRQRLSSTLPGNSTDLFFAGEVQQGVMGYSLGFDIITPEFVRHAHTSLMSIVAWTVDTIPDTKAVIAKGVDGIITDDCELVQWVALDVKTRK